MVNKIYKVKINMKECIGCGSCSAVCPDVFEPDGEKARVKESPTDKECVKEAEETCPTKAIILSEVSDSKNDKKNKKG